MSVSAIFPDGSIHEQSIVLGGAKVLVWESRTYAPQCIPENPTPKGAYVVFQAMPNFKDVDGNILNPKNLVYVWRKMVM